MPDRTAMMLTQKEWEDLAFICEVYKREFESGAGISLQIARRVRLADRVIDAAEAE